MTVTTGCSHSQFNKNTQWELPPSCEEEEDGRDGVFLSASLTEHSAKATPAAAAAAAGGEEATLA